MSISPALEAVIAYLKTQSAVSALVGTRVFGLGLPKEEADNMPRKCIVLNLAPVVGIGDQSYLEADVIGIDVFSYGDTAIEALKVQRAVHQAMKAVQLVEQDSVRLFYANRSVSPRSMTDPDFRSPVVIETWAIVASELTTA